MKHNFVRSMALVAVALAPVLCCSQNTPPQAKRLPAPFEQPAPLHETPQAPYIPGELELHPAFNPETGEAYAGRSLQGTDTARHLGMEAPKDEGFMLNAGRAMALSFHGTIRAFANTFGFDEAKAREEAWLNFHREFASPEHFSSVAGWIGWFLGRCFFIFFPCLLVALLIFDRYRVRTKERRQQTKKTKSVIERANQASQKYQERANYAKAAEEATSKTWDSGLHAKAFSESDGDEKKTIATYIRLRVAELRAEQSEPSGPDLKK